MESKDFFEGSQHDGELPHKRPKLALTTALTEIDFTKAGKCSWKYQVSQQPKKYGEPPYIMLELALTVALNLALDPPRQIGEKFDYPTVFLREFLRGTELINERYWSFFCWKPKSTILKNVLSKFRKIELIKNETTDVRNWPSFETKLFLLILFGKTKQFKMISETASIHPP